MTNALVKALDVLAESTCMRERLAASRLNTMVTNTIVQRCNVTLEIPSTLRHERATIASETRPGMVATHVGLQSVRTSAHTTTFHTTRATRWVMVVVRNVTTELEDGNLAQTKRAPNASLVVLPNAM